MSPAATPRTLVFALGANLGDPLAALRAAATGLSARLTNPRVSAVYATEPEGGEDQPPYVNAVLAGEGALTPGEALALAEELEGEAARERPYPGAPRSLDVDVLFVGDEVVDAPGLRVPHPRWRSRAFVVVPLLDVAPDLVDPESGEAIRDVARASGWNSSRFPVVLERGSLLTRTGER